MIKQLLLTLSFVLCTSTAHSSSSSCGSGDLSGVSFISCAGYIDGNLLNNSAFSLSAVHDIFSGLGYNSLSTIWTEKLSNLNGTSTIDFSTPLNGVNIIGIHKGGAGTDSQSTAFYVINAGSNLDTFKYNLGGSSSATIYSLGTISPVPEPNSYILMIAGLLIVGWVAGRKVRFAK